MRRSPSLSATSRETVEFPQPLFPDIAIRSLPSRAFGPGSFDIAQLLPYLLQRVFHRDHRLVYLQADALGADCIDFPAKLLADEIQPFSLLPVASQGIL